MSSSFSAATRRSLAIISGTLAMVAVAVLCAFFAMRVAIHGREVEVPNLSGKTDADAAQAARDLGLNLSVENRFYSPAVAPNHILSQLPVAGAHVRRDWQVRVTESLGPQMVSVPDVTGQSERPATLVLRRLQLEPASVAHLPAPSPANVILATSPPSNSSGMNGPRVALLVSDADNGLSTPAFVMPALTGLTLGTAAYRLATVGLHIASAQSPDASPDPNADPAIPPDVVDTTAATITAQSPQAGHRVTSTDQIRVALSH